MPPRFDSQTRILRLSVSDLLWIERRGEARSFGLADRSALGRQTHQRHTERQAAKNSGYEVEVPLEVQLQVENATVFLRGRADGRWVMKRFTVLEEIKSVTSGVDGEPLDSHRLQGLIYAWMHQRNTGDLTKACLSRVDIWTGETARSLLDPNPLDLETLVMERARILLHWFENEAQRKAKRAKAAQEIVWPYDGYRDGQQDMAEAVQRSLKEKRHLLLEAPTGSGKTAPILLTAFRHAAQRGKRLAYATSRVAQQVARLEFIREAIPEAARGRVLHLTAADKLCSDPTCACREPNTPDSLFDFWQPPEWVETAWQRYGGIITSDMLRIIADEQAVCPRRVQRDFCRMADVLVGDQNYFIQPQMRPPGWFEVEDLKHPDTILLLDEAHGVPERIRQALSVSLTLPALEDAGRRLEEKGGLIERQTAMHLYQFLVQTQALFEEQFPEENTLLYSRIEPDAAVLQKPLRETSLVLTTGRVALADNPDSDLLQKVENASFAVENATAYAAFVSRDLPAPTIHWVVSRPAGLLQPRWRMCGSVIAFSATLTPFDVTQRTLGLDPDRVDSLALPDQSLKERRLALRYTGVSTRAKDREQTLPRIASLVADAALATQDSWLVFVSSKPYQDWLTLALKADRRIHATAIRALDSNLLSFLMTNGASSGKPQVHVLEIHGPLREGVDLPTGVYRGVAIIGPALPPATPENEILRVTLDEQDEEGYAQIYLLPAMRTVVQASGRLLRDPDQRGVLLFVGERFAQPEFELFAPDWLQEADVVDDWELVLEVLREFF